ncbi:hypothetical protein D3C75_971030 [compost metagenome]
MIGLAGGVVSGAISMLSGLVLPALSVAVNNISSPFFFGSGNTTEKLPPSPTVTRPTSTVPSRMITVLPASAVPLAVRPSPESARLSGRSGAVVSKAPALPGGLLFSE